MKKMIEKMKNLNQFDNKKNMSKSFTIKKYWVVTLCLLFCSLKAVAQEYSDATIGFDTAKETAILKKYGVSDKDLSKELNIKRKMFTRRYITLEKINKNILQNIDSDSKNVPKTTKSTSKLAAKTLAVTSTAVPQSERDVLQAFYNIAANKTALKGWDFSTEVTTYNPSTQTGWYGITVDNGHVTHLTFYSIDLNGTIPSNINQLTQLKRLQISNANNLNGSIPNEIGQLQQLQSLHISDNQLSGTIPNEIGYLSKLVGITIYNTNISGEIPQGIFNLPNLTDISLRGFTGYIPPAIGNLKDIRLLDFTNTTLRGTLPSEMGNLSKLEYLTINSPELSGSIPQGIFNLPVLHYIYITGCQNLNGPLPSTINLPEAETIHIRSNGIKGEIPVFNCPNLWELLLDNNQLTGPISSQAISSFTNLGSLHIESNKYTFSDLISLIQGNPTIAPKLVYSPQGKIGQPKTVNTVVDYVASISMDYTPSQGDTFQWYKGISPDGVIYQNPGTNSNSDRLVFEDVSQSASGYYYFKTKSPFFGDNFVMESEPIKLNVLCYPQTNGTLNVTSSDLVVGQPINFSFESATPNLTYRWTFYNLAGEITGTSTLSNPSASQKYTQPGDYKIKLEVTQQNCITTFEKTFTVLSCTPIIGSIKIIKDTGYPFQFSNSGITSVLACNETAFPNKFYANTQTLNIGTKLYTNESLSTPVPVTNSFAWYKTQDNATAYKIDVTGKITEVYTCSTSTCNKRFLDYVTVVAQEPITLNYFLPNGTEVNKTFEPVPRGGDQTYTFSIGTCISETTLTIDGPVLNQTVAWNDNQNCCQATSRAYRFSSPGRDSASEACSAITFPDTFYAASTSLGIGTQLYLDPELKTKVGSGNTWRQEGIDGLVIRIANDGTVAQFDDCGAGQPATTTYYFRAAHPLGHTGRDYIRYIDASGNEIEYEFTRYEGTLGPCEEIIAQSILYKTGLLTCTPGQD